MEIDEIYKEWCGISRLENSVKLVHDSTEAIEFAEYYHKSLKNNADIAVVSEWVAVKDRLPICYKSGDWDGKRSDLVLCIDSEGEKHLAECYEGTMDGSHFFEWYDKNDFGLRHQIIKWAAIG